MVKAFGTANRGALWEVLGEFGMPTHFARVSVRPHAGAVVNVKMGGEGKAVGSSIGVRQGACEGPIHFLFIVQAALETMG